MAKKKTPVLPSGNYNKKVYDYTDSSGKRIYRSFTSDDEDELNFMVAEFKLRKKKTKGHPERMTLNEAITKYISTSDAVLGAKTIEEYEKIQKNGFQMLMDVELENFNPLSLYRERLLFWIVCATIIVFQSTLPIQGETVTAGRKGSSSIFQSTLPIQGETGNGLKAKLAITGFQSTLPIQGETKTACRTTHTGMISIHSPYTGRDCTKF